MTATTAFENFNPITAFHSDRLAAIVFGAAILLSSPNAAAASSTAASSPHPKVNLFVVGSSRESTRKEKASGGSYVAASAQDAIIAELGRLADGWAGADSVAPSLGMQREVADVLAVLNLPISNIPEVHVDDDGCTSLIWAYDADRLLSLEFFGKGYVACSFAHSNPDLSRFAKLPVADEVGIMSFMEAIAPLISDATLSAA